jgi:hypothetical protein
MGKKWDDLTDFPILGTREIWDFENPTNSPHPMHVHLVRFQILDKTDLNTGQPIPLEPWEINTWKDIVRVPPNARARIIMDFEDYLGRYPQHCHILDHEDHEMMRQFQTTNDPANCNNNGVCEVGEDCQSCSIADTNDCAQVSGALCGNGLCEAGDGENCITCPDDCAGKQKGSVSRQFCCGFDDGQVTNPVEKACGVDVNDDRCIDSGAELFCRVEPRLSACCGDMLCEGAETDIDCALDCATEPPQPPVCTYNDPTVAISPTAQDITTDGGSVDYTVSITNNDTAACADTTFDLTASDTNGVNFVIPSNLGQNSVPLAPGANTDVTLTVTGQTDAPNGATNDTSVMAADPAANHGDVTSNTVSTTINVGGQGNCSTFTTKQSCNAEPTCVWVNRNKVCVPNN